MAILADVRSLKVRLELARNRHIVVAAHAAGEGRRVVEVKRAPGRRHVAIAAGIVGRQVVVCLPLSLLAIVTRLACPEGVGMAEGNFCPGSRDVAAFAVVAGFQMRS